MGQKSFEYGDPAFVGFHRFGFSSSFTAGMRAEADRDVTNLGVSSAFVPWRLGETDVSLAVSDRKGRHGHAGFFNHFYAGERMSAGFSAQGFSREYANLGLSSSEQRLRFEGIVRVGVHLGSFGSLSAPQSVVDFYTDTDERSTSIFYSRRLK